jgi:methyl-accepting chemotaxis protein
VAGEEMIPMLVPFLKAVKNLDDHQGGKVESSSKQIGQAASSIRKLTITVATTVLFLGLFSAISIIRSITVPLNKVHATITHVEKSGDFTQRIALDSNDEVGETAKAFDDLIASLQKTFSEVLESSTKLSKTAQNLSAASGRLADSSSVQSESTSAMAAAVEQMTVSTNQVSDSARDALGVSRQSGDLSSQGGGIIDKAALEMSRIAETVRGTSRTIEEVGQNSNQISSVVKLIKDIADQTNLLALNAAIEAARAGDQGRGFAVVADEVRNLAERTSSATEEISKMIAVVQHSAQLAVKAMENSVKEVGNGVDLANQAGSTIVRIKNGANHVVDVVNDISSALAEQCEANNSLAGQVEKVAQLAEINSVAASQTASEADNLQKLANSLQDSIKHFKI